MTLRSHLTPFLLRKRSECSKAKMSKILVFYGRKIDLCLFKLGFVKFWLRIPFRFDARTEIRTSIEEGFTLWFLRVLASNFIMLSVRLAYLGKIEEGKGSSNHWTLKQVLPSKNKRNLSLSFPTFWQPPMGTFMYQISSRCQNEYCTFAD